MKIVHLVVDDKFIDSAIREFEAVGPGLNDYLILDAQAPFRYLRSPRVRSVQRADLIGSLRHGDVASVVVHGMTPQHLALLPHIPPGPAVVWIGWGYDYYGLLNDAFPDGLMLPATTAALARLGAREPRHRPGVLRCAELSVARPYAKPTHEAQQALRRVDHFSPVLDTEFHLVKRHQPWFGARHLPWNYMTLEDDLQADAPPLTPGPDILVGNSATATNNHLEAFELIRQRVRLDGRRLVVPLSYGDPAYAELVTHVGRKTFGDAFVPLREFIAKDAYLALLNGCGIVVMNHVRQQALGNIVIGGLIGARVFLNARNPIRPWLQSRGMAVDDIAALHTTPLSVAERQAQHAVIAGFTCRRARRAMTAGVIEVARRTAGAAVAA